MKNPEDFVEQMGLLMERNGQPRIAGRMVGFLLLNEGAHALEDLADRLHVSKASISTNARLLEQRGFIKRVALPGDRRDFYRINEAPWEQLFRYISEQLSASHRLLDAARSTLPLEDERVRQRLTSWADFHAFLLENFADKIARWRERRSA